MQCVCAYALTAFILFVVFSCRAIPWHPLQVAQNKKMLFSVNSFREPPAQMRFFACSVKIRISKLPKWLPCCDIVRIITTWLWGSLTNPWFCWMFFAYRPLRVPIYLGRPILAWLRPSRPREGICIGKKRRWWMEVMKWWVFNQHVTCVSFLTLKKNELNLFGDWKS